MLKRLALLIAVIVLLSSTFAAAPARADEVLKYGASVDGEITKKAATASYTFEGKKGELAFVQLILIEGADDVSTLEAVLQLKDPKGKVIADTGEFEYTVSGVFAEAVARLLPADGTYTIDISVAEDADDDSKVGKYTLQLIQPEKLAAGKTADISAKYKGYDRFIGVYQIVEKESFVLNLQSDGKNTANLSLHQYNADSGFSSMYEAGGRGVKSVDLTLESPKDLYLVTVSGGLLFSETQLKFKLSLKAAK